MQHYDVIGDVHGCADDLVALLVAMGYTNDTGVFRHRSNQAIFVGDLIDRGSQQLEVLQIVKGMVDAESARIVMGNHEFNAICYSIPTEDGGHLRPHSDNNYDQHKKFLAQVSDEQEHQHYLDWFRTLPLWLDLGGVRVIHACWHEPSMKIVEQHLGSNIFSATAQFVNASTTGHELYETVETLLKGPELPLAEYGLPPYRDKDGATRQNARARWWSSSDSLRDVLEISGTFTTADGAPYPLPPDVPAENLQQWYDGQVPVIYGHYWRQGEPEMGHDWTERTACVDFSAVKGGQLTAYRWQGEGTITPDHYFRCKDA